MIGDKFLNTQRQKATLDGTSCNGSGGIQKDTALDLSSLCPGPVLGCCRSAWRSMTCRCGCRTPAMMFSILYKESSKSLLAGFHTPTQPLEETYHGTVLVKKNLFPAAAETTAKIKKTLMRSRTLMLFLVSDAFGKLICSWNYLAIIYT